MESSIRFVYEIRPIKPIKDLIPGQCIRRACSMQLTEKEALLCMQYGSVWRKFPGMDPLKVTGDNLHLMHRDSFGAQPVQLNNDIKIEEVVETHIDTPVVEDAAELANEQGGDGFLSESEEELFATSSDEKHDEIEELEEVPENIQEEEEIDEIESEGDVTASDVDAVEGEETKEAVESADTVVPVKKHTGSISVNTKKGKQVNTTKNNN